MALRKSLLLALVPLALGIGACSRSTRAPSATRTGAPSDAAAAGAIASAESVAFAAPSALTATLADSTSIDLHWTHNATEPVGYWIEFKTPEADFVKLDLVSPPTSTFRHSDLAPETTFIYRVLPLFGRL